LAVQIHAISSGLNVACGCYGSADENPIGAKSLALAAAGLAVSMVGFATSRSRGKR
jgi:hypothetical protein